LPKIAEIAYKPRQQKWQNSMNAAEQKYFVYNKSVSDIFNTGSIFNAIL